MSRHTQSDWSPGQIPVNHDIEEVVRCLLANRRSNGVWTPPAWAVNNPTDGVYLMASRLLDICAGKPTKTELDVACGGIPDVANRVGVYGFLQRIFKRLEIPRE